MCSSVVSSWVSSMLFYLFFFFFSSRRRHTRLVSDWSSTCALPILRVHHGQRWPFYARGRIFRRRGHVGACQVEQAAEQMGKPVGVGAGIGEEAPPLRLLDRKSVV